MIKLKYIYINGFKTPNNSIEVHFSNEQASVIYGDNGSGKTTFLRILHALFSQDESTLIAEDVQEIAVGYTYISESIEKADYFSVYRLEEDDLEEDELDDLFSNEPKYNYDWADFEFSHLSGSKSISLGVDRGSASPKINISPLELRNFFRRRRNMFNSLVQMNELAEDLSSFIRHKDLRKKSTKLANYENDHVFLKAISMDNVGETLHTRYRSARRNAARRVQNALFDTLALVIGEQGTKNQPLEEMIPPNINELIFENKEIIIEALDDSLENSFKDTIVEELRKINDIDDVSNIKGNTLLIKLLLKMSEQLKDGEDELSAINVIIDKFDSFTSEGKNLEISMDDIAINSQTGRHPISELSSGERHILTLLTLLLDQGRNRDFIIIDEPEISLNTKWQEILLPTLSEILPNAQIIVASHSPLIAQSIDNLVELKAV